MILCRFIAKINLMSSVTFLSSLFISLINSIEIIPPPTLCGPNEYFDSILLSCNSCKEPNSLVDTSTVDGSGNYYQCKCREGFKKLINNCQSDTSGFCFSFTCVSCLQGHNASYSDGSGCVSCGSTTVPTSSNISSTSDCKCPVSSGSSIQLVLKEVQGLFGVKLNSKMCTICPAGKFVLLKDTVLAGKSYQGNPYDCQACPDVFMTLTVISQDVYSCDCISGYTKVGQPRIGIQSCIKTADATTYLNLEKSAALVSYYSISQSLTSLIILHYFTKVATQCMAYGDPMNMPDCQTLVNLCTLVMYDNQATICITYRNILQVRATSTVTNIYGWTRGLPWLYYDTSSFPCYDKSITMSMSFDSMRMQYIVTKYTINGTYVGIENVTTLFHYCSRNAPYTDKGGGSSTSTLWQLFGTSQAIKLDCQLSNLLTQTQYFYDLFVVDTSTKKWYPVPVRITNLRSNGANPNTITSQLCSTSDVFVRRFFLFDILSGQAASTSTSTTSTSTLNTPVVPSIIRYASQITLEVQIQSMSQDTIYGPILTIQFTELSQPITSTSIRSYNFIMRYTMDTIQYKNTEQSLIIFAVFVMIAVWYRNLRAWRSRNTRVVTRVGQTTDLGQVNIKALIQMLFLIFQAFIFVYLPFIVIEAEYWFVFFKLQKKVYIMLPPADTLFSTTSFYIRFFVILYLLAFLQTFNICVLIYRQCNLELFFLDWEPPKDSKPGNKIAGKVSVWRTILVTNRWVELQTIRRIDIRFTLFWLGCILLGFNYEYNYTSQPNINELSNNAIMNPLLRFANTIWWWFLLSVLQYLWKVGIWERFFTESIETQFIDFCTISKISVLLLDEPYHGYYLHCRSPHQYADGTMAELVELLRNEEAGLTVDRSLEGAPDDHQSFQLFLTAEWRDTFSAIHQNIVTPMSVGEMINNSKLARGRFRLDTRQDGATEVPPQDMSRMLKGWMDMTIFLQGFVENSFTRADLRRRVETPTWLQRALNMAPPLLETGQPSVFFPDYSYNFTSAWFLGNEWDFAVMNALSYSVFDLWFNSTSVSILLTFLLDTLLCKIRHHWGKSAVSRSTLVDKRFLN